MTRKIRFLIWAGMSGGYLVGIHLRTIGILAVSLVVLIFWMHRDNIKIKKILCILVLVFATFGVVLLIRKGYLGYLTPHVDWLTTDVLDGNDFNGQAGKILYFFTAEGFIEFWRLFCGKLFYAFSDSFIMVWPGMVICVLYAKEVILNKIIYHKNMSLSPECAMCIITSMCMFAAIVIGCLFMINARNSRMDIMTFGRYFEYTIGPFVLFGLLSINKTGLQKFYCKFWLACGIGVYFLIAIITDKYQNYDTASSHIPISSTWMYTWFRKDGFSRGVILHIALSVVVFVIIFDIIYIVAVKKQTAMLGIFTFLFLATIYFGMYTYTNGIMPWHIRQGEKEEALHEFIVDNGIEDRLYCDLSDPCIYEAMHQQFMLKDNALHVVKDADMFIDEYPAEYLLTCAYSGNDNMMNKKGFQLIMETEKVKLWIYNPHFDFNN